ncbi:hypothetical protein RND71_005279 [Anisodus tanguticus]|uniref:Uncharacterized protein n=1 Tax=Anisodus tanguticus TaxID=243964 RepID=A0AAE1VMI0_9SOLA|nr:hypothetical protein RND71_005279 [Anisodus tanguticus]
MEICSIGSENFSQVNRLKWGDHLYVGEFDDLHICNSNSNEVLKQLVPIVENCNSQSTTMQSSSQLERNVSRMGELFAMVGEEMHVIMKAQLHR